MNLKPRTLTSAQEAELARIRAELDVAIEEAAADSGMDPGQIYGDIIEAVCFDIADNDIVSELCRRELGYAPSGFVAERL